ncbi:MAG: hypothetical protein COW04_03895 [Deltaproteobacteria bacterium CG12_big_fil_rev_8_21_14_0_65_43_10]|nr:MAG: hypothetical protein AUK23_01910 [Deltaproteobacteria bacterium CG2_30_43_15]PIQ46121.1 MAG: hypothetical protein COW04_03895 [Deltaproteobacteria bacterium CG12_big_fil_rev_8_21_14_0_65_43_10]PIU86496.1 MAG: hypothetical protein COS67_02005 [Deltaproteobacteria bacterium CG06_land_8_20_14_3_00_44_19]PIX26742.1 MAG: hypothetical protein COZ68_00245 [Deltaproteobacteria bacterium CG_4_8_14_3_um_filter_43_13]PIZ19223.1 MAG: hypothetical protein COY50_11070 [Deltaproteobacteria bacterium C
MKSNDIFYSEEEIKFRAEVKEYAAEDVFRITNNAVQILGGVGLTKDYPIEGFFEMPEVCPLLGEPTKS